MDDFIVNGNNIEDIDEDRNSVRITSDNEKYPDSRLAGLQGWAPGQSGNPNGRPKGTKDGFRAQLNRLMAKDAPLALIQKFEAKIGDMDCKTYAGVLAQILVLKGTQGDLMAMREILAQVEVPHPKNVNLNGDFNVAIPSQFADAF